MKFILDEIDYVIIETTNITKFVSYVLILSGFVGSLPFFLMLGDVPWLIPVIILAIPVVIGVVMIIFNVSYKTCFDRKNRKVSICRTRNLKEHYLNYSFDDIEKIETREHNSMRNVNVRVVETFVLLRNGTRLRLSYPHGPKGRVIQQESAMSQKIADFIGVGYHQSNLKLSEIERDAVLSY